MRLGPALIVVGTLALGSCASSNDVRSTASSSSDQGERLPPVDEPTPASSVSEPSTTLPGTRPVADGSLVLLASDLPGWDVVAPIDVAAESTWEALDCPDMDLAWGATGRLGTRSRGTNGAASFRNTAVEFATAAEAGEVLDAVDRVSSECTLFETDDGSFWSEPIAMPPSTHRTAGLVIGSENNPSWTLAYWQIDTAVVVLEVEGEEMWNSLDPLLTTLSARLDGTPTPMTPEADEPLDDLPVIVPATPPPVEISPTSTEPPPVSTVPLPEGFPPSDEDWAEHPLAYLAPTPDDLGPGWEYQYGSLSEAEPPNPDDAIDGCEAPVPPTLHGYDLSYENGSQSDELAVMVGEGTAEESQVWIEAFRAIAECTIDESQFIADFDLVDRKIDGVDDAVFIAGTFDIDEDVSYMQVIGAARVNGLLIAAFIALEDTESNDIAVHKVGDVLTSMLAER